MQLHELKPNTIRKSKKRIGRGGKRGAYSGRGQKGQRARSGGRIPSGIHEMLISTPKLRGYRNKPKSKKNIVLNLDVLSNIKSEIINKDILIKEGIIKKGETVKILNNGEIKDAKKIVGIKISKSAVSKIKKAGGTITEK